MAGFSNCLKPWHQSWLPMMGQQLVWTAGWGRLQMPNSLIRGGEVMTVGAVRAVVGRGVSGEHSVEDVDDS